MTTANVVDVSEWQPTSIDWANLKANGVQAVVVRIGHGTTRDTNAADHISNATKAGLIVHVYHYYEGVDGELQYSVNNAKSLNVQPNVYYFLDMEGTIAGSWSSIFESYRKAWVGYGWNTGLYCSLSNYAKFDDATLVKQGVYRWIAAWGSTQPSNADMWQYDSKTGLGSYTSALDKDVDISGKLIKEPDSTVVEPTDPNGNYTIKPGAFVGFDHSTTELQGGEMLVASPDGQNKIPKLAPTGAFLFNNADGDNMWALIKPKIQMPKLDWSAITGKPDVALKSDLTWSSITDKPDIALKSDLTWSNVTGKPDVALKPDVAAVSAVASTASAKATSNAATIASVSSTANSALSVANSNAKVLPNKLDKADLTWSNVAGRPDVDKIASQASQAVVTANTAQSQASAAGQAASSASAQASAAKASADTATATANAAKASASTASATAASAQQVANSASASASATAVALKSKADTATVNAQFTAVNSSVASAQSTADSAVAGLANKLDKTALTWGNIANKPTNLATTDSVAKAQSAANSAVSMASGATATANSAKSAATSAAGVANTANTTANTALSKANSAVSVASQANSNASSAMNTANTANSNANQANSKITDMQANGGGVNLVSGTGLEYVMGYGIPNTVWKDGYAYLKLPSNTTSSEVLPQDPHTFFYTLTKGTTYTQTIWFETDAKLISSSIQITWFTSAGHAPQPATLINLGENKYKLYSTYMWPGKSDNSVRLFDTFGLDYAFDLSTGTYLKFGKLMLEKGTVAHDWSPAPEDIQSEIDANSALIKSNTTAINNAKTAAANAQSSANSAQNTANTAIKVSETLKDLGNYTATASGTTANSPTTGLPRTSGVSMSEVYDNGYPTTFGNVLNVAGGGSGQLLLGWSGNDNTTEHLWYRSHRDTSTGGWGTWQKIAYVSDLTWSNISGKPDVATKADVSSALTVANTAKSTADSALSKANSNATTLNNKVNKSDLTWANISGKPSIPSTFNGSITDTSTDFNNLVTEGHYDIRFSPSTQGKNGPNQGNWGLLDVKVAGRMIVQTYYSDQSNEVYVRNRHDGTWSGWRWVNFWLG